MLQRLSQQARNCLVTADFIEQSDDFNVGDWRRCICGHAARLMGITEHPVLHREAVQEWLGVVEEFFNPSQYYNGDLIAQHSIVKANAVRALREHALALVE